MLGLEVEALNVLVLLAFLFAHPGLAKSEAPVSQHTLYWVFSATQDVRDEDRARFMTEDNPILKILTKHLPEYQHNFMYGTVQRVEKELQGSKLVCFPASSNLTRRVAFAYLTPIGVLPDPVIVTRKDIADKYLQKDGTISLQDLVKDPDVKGLFPELRSYGSKIDDVIFGKASKVRSRPMAPFGANIMMMIQNHRADFTLEFPIFLEALKKTVPLAANMVTAPIHGLNQGIPSYVACSRTPGGLEVITKIDSILRESAQDPIYKKTLLSMATTAEAPRFAKEVDHYLMLRKKKEIY